MYSLLHKEEYRPKYYRQVAEHCIDKINYLTKNGTKPNDVMVLTRIFNNPIFNEIFLVYANKKNRYKNPPDLLKWVKENSGSVVYNKPYRSTSGLVENAIFLLKEKMESKNFMK